MRVSTESREYRVSNSLHQITTSYYLQKEDDDEEDAICSEEHPGLFESATVSEDGDDEDESADGNKDISGLLYHCWLNKVLGKKDVVKVKEIILDEASYSKRPTYF